MALAPTVHAPATSRRPGLLAAAVAATFLGASLGFAVQPIVSRQLLPRLGGSASVWNTTLVFFQAVLLGGYLLTHLTSTRLSPRAQALAHVGLLVAAVALLPVAIPKSWQAPTQGNPVWWQLGVLAITVGLPYLAVATTSPLVQRWFSLGQSSGASDPYFLYAVSNIGSFTGLLAVPLVLDRTMPITTQARWWTAAYVAFVLCCVAVVWLVRPDRPDTTTQSSAPTDEPIVQPEATTAMPKETLATTGGSGQVAAPLRWSRLRWIVLAFVPSSLIMGVTSHITTDVASVPLLWVVPLGLYLLTHVLAFARHQLPERTRLALAALAVGAALTENFIDYTRFPFDLAPHLAALFFVGLACHGRLADTRPPASRLTSFYLSISIGGLLGGMFNAIVSPIVFSTVIEYPLVLSIALLVLGGLGRSLGRLVWRRVDLVAFSAAVPLAFATAKVARSLVDRPVILVCLVASAAMVAVLARQGLVATCIVGTIAVLAMSDATSASIRNVRGFYGAIRVEEDGTFRQLVHGTTIHGYQFLDPTKKNRPTSYYAELGPLGQMMTQRISERGGVGTVGVIGLGVGTVAAYGRPGDSITYYEIDPLIVELAEDPSMFSYLSDSEAEISIVVGDGRRRIEQSTQRYDEIVLDAFSSDSIPVHLLTVEAFEIYREKLAADGVLAVHISNRYLDLEPVVAAIADELGMAVVTGNFSADEGQEAEGATGADWLLLARDRRTLDPYRGGIWRESRRDPSIRAWTDDRSDLLAVLHT